MKSCEYGLSIISDWAKNTCKANGLAYSVRSSVMKKFLMAFDTWSSSTEMTEKDSFSETVAPEIQKNKKNKHDKRNKVWGQVWAAN
jgi:hypothetical protein